MLVLHAGCDNDELRSDLEPRTLKRIKNTYEAISYVWGDPNNTRDIECNGNTVQITTNLADALLQFRHPKRKRRLWVDALCINQADNNEKSLQVSRMGQIYKNAKRVLVWLGPDLGDGAALNSFALVRWMNGCLDAEYLQSDKNLLAMQVLRSSHGFSERASSPRLNIDKRYGPCLIKLISHPWFFRVWTVQECGLAKDCQVYWGSYSISIADIFEFAFWNTEVTELYDMTWTGYHHRTFRSLYILFENLHIHYQSKGSWHSSKPGLVHSGSRLYNNSSFAETLYGAHNLDATDARDRVYAFLGSPHARNKQGEVFVQPNYNLSIGLSYIRIAYALLQDPQEGPELLRAVSHETREDVFRGENQSWVPDWSRSKERGTKADPYARYSAGGQYDLFEAELVIPTWKCMAISGFVFDKVVLITPPLEDLGTTTTLDDGSIELSIDALWRKFSAKVKGLGIDIDYDAFLQTLFEGKLGPTMYENNNDFDGLTDFDAFRKVLLWKAQDVPECSNHAPTGRQHMIAGWACSTLRNKRGLSLILTEHGGIGLALGEPIRVGDVCCVFLGAAVPFILAPVDLGQYRLVTECYIQGVMSGELVDKLDAYKIVLR